MSSNTSGRRSRGRQGSDKLQQAASKRNLSLRDVKEEPKIMGYLSKKSPKKVALAHVWQRRFCVLLPVAGRLCYYRTKGDFDRDKSPQGMIPIDRMEKLKVLAMKRDRRFDILVEGGRLFCFQTDSREETDSWVDAIGTIQRGHVKPLTKDTVNKQFWKNQHDDMSSYMEDTPFSFRLNSAQTRAFASFFTLKRYKRGNAIFMQNQPVGQGLFRVIVTGEVNIYAKKAKRVRKKKEKTIARIDQRRSLLKQDGYDDQLTVLQNAYKICTKSEGFFLGGATIVDGVRIATAVAAKEVTVLELTKEGLHGYLNHYPDCKNVVLPLMGFNPADHLKRIDMFSGIPPIKLSLVGTLLRYVALNDTDILFEEGTVGGSMYIVSQGTVVAIGRDNEGDGRELHTFYPGDVFGEISIIMDVPRTASIIANSDALLLELRKEDFKNFLNLIPASEQANLSRIMKKQTSEHFRKYKVPFFESIPDDKYAILANLCDIQTYDADKVLFKQGEIGNSFYIIAHGETKVTVTKCEANGQENEIELCRMGPGKYFGEIALVQDTPRTATVTTVVRCVILSITKEKFQEFFHQAPEAVADFEIKLARYGVNLRSVIYHPVGLSYFEKHLKLEYSFENIDFWKSCRDFRHLFEGRYEGDLSLTNRRPISDAMRAKLSAGSKLLRSCLVTLYSVFVSRDRPDLVNEMVDAMNSPTHRASIIGDSLHLNASCTVPQSLPTSMLAPDSPDEGDNDDDDDDDEWTEPDFITADQIALGVKYVLFAELPAEQIDTICKRMGGEDGRVSQAAFVEALDSPTDDVLLVVREAALKEFAMAKTSFDHYDEKHSGVVDFFEFSGILNHKYNQSLTNEQIRERFNAIDEDGTQGISLNEFLKYVLIEILNKHRYKVRLQRAADYIVERWIQESASEQVNILGTTAASLIKAVKDKKVSSTMFDEAETEIFALMASDSFNRFKQSPLFQEFMGEAHAYIDVDQNEEEEKKKKDRNMSIAINKVRSGSVVRASTPALNTILDLEE